MLKKIIYRLKNLRFLWYAIMVGFSTVIDTFFSGAQGFFRNEWFSWGVSSLIVVAVALAIDMIIYLLGRPKIRDAEETRQIVNDTGKRYPVYAEERETPMFYISDSEERFIREGGFDRKQAAAKKKNRPVVYYSLSVKKYLNWIDYSFFHYLRSLREELRCDVVIALHYNDEMRRSSQISARNRNYYKALREWFVGVVKKIIGGDTIISFEDVVYEKYAENYAEEFHQYYAYQVLEGAKELTNGTDGKYGDFKRILSNIESSFPIARIAKKYARSRQLYVLDRDKNLSDWQEKDILCNIKRKYPFVIIAAKTLTDRSGRKINVHDESYVPNFTDGDETLKTKINNLDPGVSELMYGILSADNHVDGLTQSLPADEARQKELLYKLMLDLRCKYKIDSFDGKVAAL